MHALESGGSAQEPGGFSHSSVPSTLIQWPVSQSAVLRFVLADDPSVLAEEGRLLVPDHATDVHGLAKQVG